MEASIHHVGKERKELEAHQAELVTEAERQLKHHDSAFEDLVAALQRISTKVIAEATGHNPRTVRRRGRGTISLWRPCSWKRPYRTNRQSAIGGAGHLATWTRMRC